MIISNRDEKGTGSCQESVAGPCTTATMKNQINEMKPVIAPDDSEQIQLINEEEAKNPNGEKKAPKPEEQTKKKEELKKQIKMMYTK